MSESTNAARAPSRPQAPSRAEAPPHAQAPSRPETTKPHPAASPRTPPGPRLLTVPRAAGGLAVVLAALLAAGCGGGEMSADAPAGSGAALQEERGAGGGEAAQAAPGEAGAGGAEAGEEGGDNGAAGTDVDPEQRRVVHTASLTVEADDVQEASSMAKELVADTGGHVAAETYTPSGERAPSAALVLKVPQDEYDAALEDLAGLGDRTSLQREAEDVTEEVADVDSRVESAEAALDRLRDLLEEAEGVEDVLRVESEIADRQADLEALQARQKALGESTAFGTIELDLQAPAGLPADDGDGGIGFLGGLAYGWQALVAVAGGVAVAVGWLLPFLAVAAVVLAPLAWWRRRGGKPVVPLPRRRARRPRTAAATAPPEKRDAADGGDTPEGESPESDTPEGGAPVEDEAADAAPAPEGPTSEKRASEEPAPDDPGTTDKS